MPVTFSAPSKDILFAIKHLSGIARPFGEGIYADLHQDVLEAVVDEAGIFAEHEIVPLNIIGDRQGARLEQGRVIMPEGWKRVYDAWAQAGWNGIKAGEAHGGQGLPHLVWAVTTELWNAANMAFGINPVLIQGAIDALEQHADERLKGLYLPKLVSGEWTGTMNLTEAQAGSDLSALRAQAERQGDGTYRISGEKIFITYGDHELTANILHLVLARLNGAPEGTRGISLFLVPKFLVNEDGSLGERNKVVCAGLEHKLGIHASPTCSMVFAGAVGYLIGDENRGLNCMFTMMNSARLAVGLQGVGIAERALQQGMDYAQHRIQGGVAISLHPDVQRMLLTMQSLTMAARAICYHTAYALDGAAKGETPHQRQQAQEMANLLTPIAKAFATDTGSDVASLNIQVHGGMGYIEETGAAQHYRDARIASIYEGTNGIQAIDLVMRKLPQSQGETVRAHIQYLRSLVARIAAGGSSAFDQIALRLAYNVQKLSETTEWLLAPERTQHEKLAGATPYLRLYALTLGSCVLAAGALAEGSSQRVHLACFFADNIATATTGLGLSIMEGSASVHMPF
jgi:acyl-CoA dehydrogenase